LAFLLPSVQSPHRLRNHGRDLLDKTTRPLYAAVVRVAARSDDRERCVSLLRGVAGALYVPADPQGNELIPLDNEGYDTERHEQDLLHRRSLRGGMLINSSELVFKGRAGQVSISAQTVCVVRHRMLGFAERK